MRFGLKPLLLGTCVVVLLAASANACVNNNATNPPGIDASTPEPDSAIPPNPTTDATVPDATVPDATSLPDAPAADTAVPPADAFDAGPMAQIRVAWLDDLAYPGVTQGDAGAPTTTFDACVAVHGTNAWQGPLLAKAGSPGLGLFQVSRYFDVPPGQYDVRVVAVNGGTATCDLVDGGQDGGLSTTDFTALPAVAANARLTVVATPVWTSETPGSVNVVGLVDEPAAPAGKVSVRFMNASGTDGLDYGFGGGAVFTPLFTGVSTASGIATADVDAGTNVGVDSNGYLTVDPFTLVDTSAQIEGTDMGISPGLDAPAGTMLSAFAVYGTVTGAGVIVCTDGSPSAASPLLTSCTAVGPTSEPPSLRFAHFIADPGFPNIDFCLKYHSMPSYGPTSIGSPQQGTPYSSVSESYQVHAGFTYDVRVVAGGALDCSTGVTPDVQFVAPTSNTAVSTMVLTGFVNALDGGAPGMAASDGGGLASTAFATFSLVDQGCVATETPPVVRVVNVASSAVGPQSATLTTGAGWSMTNIPYGGVGAPAGVDACGYLATSGANGNLSTLGGGWSYNGSVVQTQTLFLFSLSQSTTLVEVLECDDSDPDDDACTVLSGS